MRTIFEGSNFVVRDLRQQIDAIRGPGFPYGWRGPGHGVPYRAYDRGFRYVVLHQNYGNIIPGLQGPLAAARFLTGAPKLKCGKCGHTWLGSPKAKACPKHPNLKPKRVGGGRGFPKLAYHAWVPYAPQHDEKGRAIIYQLLDFQERSWHAGEANEHGVALCFQGKFYSRHLRDAFQPWPDTNGRPSEDQTRIVDRVYTEWLRPTLGLGGADIKGHFDFGKPPCPGDELEFYVRNKRGENFVLPPLPDRLEDDPFDTWEERQRALVLFGYDLGNYGLHKDGIDGKPGYSTRHAIEAFQEDEGLVVDGLWGPQTQAAMSKKLLEKK